MNSEKITKFWEKVPYIMTKIPTPGALLVTGNQNVKNVMTIGWLYFGVSWGEVVITILVRPSRYSYELLKENDDFTINFMPQRCNDILMLCGSKSGKYCDKFQEANIRGVPSKEVATMSIKDAEISLECQVLYRHAMVSQNLNDLYNARYYSSQDYHEMITAKLLDFKSIV